MSSWGGVRVGRGALVVGVCSHKKKCRAGCGLQFSLSQTISRCSLGIKSLFGYRHSPGASYSAEVALTLKFSGIFMVSANPIVGDTKFGNQNPRAFGYVTAYSYLNLRPSAEGILTPLARYSVDPRPPEAGLKAAFLP